MWVASPLQGEEEGEGLLHGGFLLLRANFLGAPTRHAEVQTIGGSLVRRRLTFPLALPKNFFAALVERVAATVLHALKQRLHQLELLHPVPEFRDFSLGEVVPAFRWKRPGREPEKELAYFLQSEPRLSSALHHS